MRFQHSEPQEDREKPWERERREQDKRMNRTFIKMMGTLFGGGALFVGSILVCAGYPNLRPNVFGDQPSEIAPDLQGKERQKWIKKIEHHLAKSSDFKAVAKKEAVDVNERAEIWANAILDSMTANGIPVTEDRLELALILLHRESRLQVNPESNIKNAYARYMKALDDKVDEVAPEKGRIRDYIEGQIDSFEDQYGDRIKNSETEKELDDVLAELRGQIQPALSTAYPYIPVSQVRDLWNIIDRKLRVRTFGALQVGTDIGGHYYKARGENDITPEEVKARLFTLEGNLDVGFALFFAAYDAYEGLPDRLKYTFADYNSGVYSSRNAGFQQMVSVLSGQQLALDGDCLRYDGDWVSKEVSNTERAVNGIHNLGWFWEGEYTMYPGNGLAGMQVTEHFVRNDLEQEKTAYFVQDPLYLRVSDLYSEQTGNEPIRALIPKVSDPGAELKYGRGFDTQWYVDDSMKYVKNFKW